MKKNRISIFRKAHFNAAHKLYNDNWSVEKNKEVFGKCANPNFHGHNYEIEVKVTGEIDADTGFVMNLKELKDIIKSKIEDKFDHKNLNLDIEEFRNQMASTENLNILIYEILRNEINPAFDLKVRLFESPRNYTEYPA